MQILINGEKKYNIKSAAIRYNSISDTSSLIISSEFESEEIYSQFKEDLKNIESLTILRNTGESNVSEFNFLSKFDRNMSDTNDMLNIILCRVEDLTKAATK